MADEPCAHIEAITDVKQPARRVCEECVKVKAQWMHLRTCQECGVTLCCDNSPNRHASQHARASGHPVIASAEPGERWLYTSAGVVTHVAQAGQYTNLATLTATARGATLSRTDAFLDTSRAAIADMIRIASPSAEPTATVNVVG